MSEAEGRSKVEYKVLNVCPQGGGGGEKGRRGRMPGGQNIYIKIRKMQAGKLTEPNSTIMT